MVEIAGGGITLIPHFVSRAGFPLARQFFLSVCIPKIHFYLLMKHHHAHPSVPKSAPETPAAPADAAPAAAPAPAADPVADLQAQVAELTDKLLRARADFDNYRKRMQRDLQDIRIQERLSTIRSFLGVLDHFQMAREHFDKALDLASLKQGMEMIHAEFRQTLSGLGVEPVTAEGGAFDPRLHEAVSQEVSDTVPAGAVIRQWKAGYRVGDALLRPAVVVVSSGPAAPAAAEPAPAAALEQG